ncbi:MAG TPA: hypothetical protein VII87_04500, partial [Solirubrobacteraceae bacterium]
MNLKVPDQGTLDLVGKSQAGETDDLAPQVLIAQALDEMCHALRVGAERAEGVLAGPPREPPGLAGIHGGALLDGAVCLDRQ